MNRMTLIDTAPIPGGGELRLFQEGEHFSIKIAGVGDLMSTRMHGSEDALARLGCERIASRTHARVLIGGLGMGFTLAAALKLMRDNAEIVVAELVPGVVEWNRGPLGAHAGYPLNDTRVSVHEADVADLLKKARAAYDAILLDVDNGPGGLTHEDNNWLYSAQGLSTAFQALRVGGVLAVWSAHPDRAFTERLRRCGFTVAEVPVRAHGNKGARHIIWLATHPAPRAPDKGSRSAGFSAPRRKPR
jgi:spermidine synthase